MLIFCTENYKETKIEMALELATIAGTILAPIISGSSLLLINNWLPVITNYFIDNLTHILNTQMANSIKS